MSIQVTCPKGHELKVKDSWAGKSGRCPKCGKKMTVPAPVSDEDVLGFIGDFVSMEDQPVVGPVGRQAKSKNDADDDVMENATSGMSLLGSAIVHHKKECKGCGRSSDLWSARCMHCGDYFEQ